MPGFIAVEMVKNPQLVGSKMPPDELIFITPNFAKYTQVPSFFLIRKCLGCLQIWGVFFFGAFLRSSFKDLVIYIMYYIYRVISCT